MSTPPIKVSSAPPAQQLTVEEKRQRFAALRARMGRSQIEVTPPAGKTGYWAPVNDTREMGRLEWLGFHVVHDDPKHPVWQANGMKDDGTYIIGDVILVEISTEDYEAIQQAYIDNHEAMMTNTKASFVEDAAKQGVPTFEVKK
jgi:hypothetical protein